MEEGVRGGRLFDLRFTMFVFDDIDSRTDSAAAVDKKLKIIAHDILPAGTADTLKLFPQNLIHEDSVLNQIFERRVDVLSERQESGPVKAFEQLELAPDPVHAGKHVIASATPTWGGLDMRAARVYLADSGRAAFMAEYQHEFDVDKSEYVLRNWRDDVHVITWSKFAAVFGQPSIPDRWFKYGFNDWARTKTERHANVAGFVTVSGQNEPLPGVIFLYNCMSFPAATQADDVARRILKTIDPAGGWDELIKAHVTRELLERHVTDTTALIQAQRAVRARVLPAHVRPVLTQRHYVRWRMSHERDDVRRVYRDVYGLPFEGKNPGQDGGLEMLNHCMQVDPSVTHPFKPGVLGYSRFFLIVDDGKDAPVRAARPDALHDSDLARYQFRRWRDRPPKMNEAGEVEHGRIKANDDFGQGLQMLFCDNCVQAAPLTKDEQVMAQLPAHVRPEAVAQVTDPHERQRLLTAQMMQRRAIEAKMHRPRNRSTVTAWRDLAKDGR
ncbi:MAG: hypothetical protein ACJ74W_01275 [Pyrinomonadaceae bacterium]